MTNRSQVFSKFNKIIFKEICAHHPDCDLYDHHIINIIGFKLCIGCTGLYSAFILLFIIDLITHFDFIIPIMRFSFGILFFIPAIIQLFWKSDRKYIKLLMRWSLGMSAYLLLTASIMINPFFLKIVFLGGYVTGIYLYSRKQAPLQLIECDNCPKYQVYNTCNVRYAKIIRIDNIELIKDILPKDLKKTIELNKVNN